MPAVNAKIRTGLFGTADAPASDRITRAAVPRGPGTGRKTRARALGTLHECRQGVHSPHAIYDP